jgi:hypothetical protein
MDLRLATLKVVSFSLLHNVPTLNQYRKFSRVTVECKHFAGYQGYPNYRWDLTMQIYQNVYWSERKTEISINNIFEYNGSRSQWPFAYCDRGFESHRGYGCFFVVCVVCCQVEVSATS